MSGTPINKENLEAYVVCELENHELIKGGAIQHSDRIPMLTLCELMHARVKPLAVTLLQEAHDYPYAEDLPLVADVPPDRIGEIANQFLNILDKVEERSTPTKEEAARAFGAFYNLLMPTTQANRYLRSLIEKSFEVLDLGSISQEKFSAMIKKPPEMGVYDGRQ